MIKILAMLTVLWRSNLGAEMIESNKHLFGDVDIILEPHKEKSLAHLHDIDILVDGNPPAELLDGKKLQHVIVPFVGIEPSLREALLQRPHIRLYNSHYNDGFVAQHTLALLLACTNRIVEADMSLRKGDWTQRYNRLESVYLEGKTCLLLGYGAIGRKLVGMVQALGMNVSVLRRSLKTEEGKRGRGEEEKVFLTHQLLEALSQANVVICSLPETPETLNLLDKTAFTAMKQESILINVGRGKVIDQYALYDALKSNHLLAAGIDVWWNYPKDKEVRANTFPSDAPLHELPNVVMSPHRANQTLGEEQVRLEDIAKTIQVIAKGETRNLVDVERGY
jgi:phosphoglycerate dehydrogenase-like enzyme